jgi:nucleoside-diphosphate-sugar epimerase
MKIAVLGGTRFIGRVLVSELVHAGTPASLFTEVVTSRKSWLMSDTYTRIAVCLVATEIL